MDLHKFNSCNSDNNSDKSDKKEFKKLILSHLAGNNPILTDKPSVHTKTLYKNSQTNNTNKIQEISDKDQDIIINFENQAIGNGDINYVEVPFSILEDIMLNDIDSFILF